MRRLVLGWKMLGLERSLGSRIVTYADDLVILCRRGKGEEALARMRQLMGKLKLTVNEEKTRSCKVPEGEFNFLGYTFAQFCAATFLIRAWLRWVISVELRAPAACPVHLRSLPVRRGPVTTILGDEPGAMGRVPTPPSPR
jgi:hypothetical protein